MHVYQPGPRDHLWNGVIPGVDMFPPTFAEFDPLLKTRSSAGQQFRTRRPKAYPEVQTTILHFNVPIGQFFFFPCPTTFPLAAGDKVVVVGQRGEGYHFMLRLHPRRK